MFVNINKISNENKEQIKFYYKEKGQAPVFPKNIFEYIKSILFPVKKQVIIVNNRWLRGGTKIILRRECDDFNTVREFSVQYRALKEAIEILNRRNVACFFFNRPGKKKNFAYDSAAVTRMKHRMSFPKMIRHIKRNEVNWKQILGVKYSPEYVEELSKIPQIVKVDNKYVHEDTRSKYVNVKNGKRTTINAPVNPEHYVYVYGRCGAFGYAVEDSETIPSCLQNLFAEKGMSDYSVVNMGLWGANDSHIIHNFLIDVSEFREGDIVIFYLKHFDFTILKKLEEKGLWFYNLTNPWHEFSEARWCFYDKPGHMNHVGYSNAARLIFDYMKFNNFSTRNIQYEAEVSAVYLTEYIKSLKDADFEKKIQEYVDIIKQDVPDKVFGANCGGIVMNCNPFTLGHRYLIETAGKSVDYLFIFVVEENRSFFTFEDRFEMVKQGTKDIENVFVVPSGKFIISALTFPEYFMKDYVKKRNFDVSNDINIFCKYIAPSLHIKTRFVGEEPFDPVTKNYNEEMKKSLPKYGMKLIEIPRMKSSTGKVINATRVRKLLNEGSIDMLREYIPDTTLDILKEKYVKEGTL